MLIFKRLKLSSLLQKTTSTCEFLIEKMHLKLGFYARIGLVVHSIARAVVGGVLSREQTIDYIFVYLNTGLRMKI